ncbi:hypothetical protein CKG00_07510 [Morganella morganii]|uniref:Sel1 repeat family protein n=1 Tax=Morganella morganii TaxID=582 RepID=A0A433ZVX8_MORMO|nr:SEL1-like repeat protein [Morganella morganii]RUT66257.1 hypothetical protein CKG00_07510 [Morganella morganii]
MNKKSILLILLPGFSLCAYSGNQWNNNITVYEYNPIELSYDPDLPEHAPYPKNKNELTSLINKSKNGNLTSRYTLFSFYYNNCYHLQQLSNGKSTSEYCNTAVNHLEILLSSDPENALTLFHYGFILLHGYGKEKNEKNAIVYYEKACHAGKNRLIAACDFTFSTFLNGEGNIEKDINKAREHVIAVAGYGNKKYQKYMNNWDYILFRMNTEKEVNNCIESEENPSVCIKSGNNKMKNYKIK